MTSLTVSVFGDDTFPEPPFDSTLDELLLSESITSSWDLTSNFACCGLILPDLHALLDHFETEHGERRPPSLEIPAPPTPPPSSCSLSDVLTPPPAQVLDALPPLPVTPCRSRMISAAVTRPTRRDRVEDKDKDRKRRKRKRQYPCTKTPGCVKEYLNKNGLKYHLEKGECVVPKASADE